MAVLTEKIIEETFMEMLKEQSLSHITVRAVAERCGISRNCFYYHFSDIPALLNRVICDELDRVIETIPENATFSERVDAFISYAVSHKAMILHIHFSKERQVVEGSLMTACRYVTDRYVQSFPPEIVRNDEYRDVIQKVVMYEIFGATLDWFNHSMKYDLSAEIHRIYSAVRNLLRLVDLP